MLRALAIAYETFDDAHKAVLRPYGLSMSDFDVIATLGNTAGLRMKDIAGHMMTSSSASNVTRVCSSLEKRGLVERRRAPDNDREVIARLTDAGDGVFRDVFGRMAKFSTAFVDSALEESEQVRVVELLTRFIENARGPEVEAATNVSRPKRKVARG